MGSIDRQGDGSAARSVDDQTGSRARPVEYEALIAASRQDHGGVDQRAEAARLAEIAENLRTLRRLAEEQARQRLAASSPDDSEQTLPTMTKPVTSERT